MFALLFLILIPLCLSGIVTGIRIFLFVHSIISSFLDNMIIDLESNDITEFSSQAATWSVSNAVCPSCDHSFTTPTYCWTPKTTLQVLGGPNILGPSGSVPLNEYFQKEYRVFENFPSLAILRFDAYLFMKATGIYTDTGSLFDVYINGVKQSDKISGTQICNPFVDRDGVLINTMIGYQNVKIRIELADISASQNGKSLTLKFVNILPYETTERSIGFRNLTLYLFKNASQYSETINFPCGYSFFWDNNRGCVPCAPYCKVCTGESYAECTSCNSPYYFYPNGTCMANCVAPFTPTTGYICNKKCTKANQPILLEYNNACSASCNSPLVLSSDGLCSVPCKSAAEYLHPDNTCQVDCPAPLQPGSWAGLVKTCSACTKYLYSNNSCLSTCPAPLLNKLTADGIKSCYNPCAGTNNFLWPDSTCVTNCFLVTVNGVDGQYCASHCPSDYIYPDVSCLPQCQPPLNAVTVGGILFCTNPCSSGYLYPNSSCITRCEAPMEIKKIAGVQYCLKNSCEDYLYPDGSCLAECESPLVRDEIDGMKYCKSSCATDDYLYPDENFCAGECSSPLIEELKNGIKYCRNTCAGYIYPNSDCISDCSSPLVQENTNGVKYCRNNCAGFIYPEGDCLDKCPSPLREENINGNKYCQNNCAGFIYPDKDCLVECPSPLVQEKIDGVKYCQNNCLGFIYPEGDCIDKCPAPLIEENKNDIKYCQNNCVGFIYPEGDCLDKCPTPLIEENKNGIQYCQNSCAEWIYPNNNCIAECPFPLVEENKHGIKYCGNTCEGIIYPDGSCVPMQCEVPLRTQRTASCNAGGCEPPLKVNTVNAIEYCESPCAADSYIYPDDSCASECKLPLKSEKTAGVFYCKNACSDYLYPDNSCQQKCEPPMIIKVSAGIAYCEEKDSACGLEEYLSKDGSCQSTNLAGQFIVKTMRDHKPIELTFIERVFNAEKQKFSIFAEDHQIDCTWSIFGLDPLEKYSLDNWNTVSNCGYFQQICGADCEMGIGGCQNNKNETSKNPWIWDNYCWSVKSAGSSKLYSSYSLNLISTIALTSFGGPGNSFISPGFTIHNSLAGQKYAPGAMITKTHLHKPTNLSSSYRYAESEGRIITSLEFNQLNTPPTLHANLQAASCNLTSMNLPLTLIHRNFNYHNQTTTPFHSYMILRRPQLAVLKTLSNYDILTPQGVRKWGTSQKAFDILDPCNQQFFTLEQDNVGNFYAQIPASQKLANSESVICIAINDVTSNQYDLVLYEIKNKSSSWIASDRFVGLLSKDYVQEMTIQLNTKADRVLIDPVLNQLDIKFETDLDTPLMVIHTIFPTTCEIFLSPICKFEISTSDEALYISKSISAECGSLYERASYICQEGVYGSFFPPTELVTTRLSKYTVNTSFFITETDDFSRSSQFVDIFTRFLSYWTLQKISIFILILIMCIFIIRCYSSMRKKNLYCKVHHHHHEESI